MSKVFLWVCALFLKQTNQIQRGINKPPIIVVTRNTADDLDLQWASQVVRGQSCETEALICKIWCYLQVDSLRPELNCRTPKWLTPLLVGRKPWLQFRNWCSDLLAGFPHFMAPDSLSTRSLVSPHALFLQSLVSRGKWVWHNLSLLKSTIFRERIKYGPVALGMNFILHSPKVMRIDERSQDWLGDSLMQWLACVLKSLTGLGLHLLCKGYSLVGCAWASHCGGFLLRAQALGMCFGSCSR